MWLFCYKLSVDAALRILAARGVEARNNKEKLAALTFLYFFFLILTRICVPLPAKAGETFFNHY